MTAAVAESQDVLWWYLVVRMDLIEGLPGYSRIGLQKAIIIYVLGVVT